MIAFNRAVGPVDMWDHNAVAIATERDLASIEEIGRQAQ